jgi:hypothetical protein
MLLNSVAMAAAADTSCSIALPRAAMVAAADTSCSIAHPRAAMAAMVDTSCSIALPRAAAVAMAAPVALLLLWQNPRKKKRKQNLRKLLNF